MGDPAPPAGEPAGPARRRFPTWAIVAIVAALAVAIAVVLVLLLRGDEGQPTADLPTGPTDQATGDAAYQELLSHLPAEAESCEPLPIDPTDEGVVAAATCVTPGPTSLVVLDVFQTTDTDATNALYQGVRSDAAVVPDSGRCYEGEVSEGEWSSGGEFLGRLLCATDADGNAVIYWTEAEFPNLLARLKPTGGESILELYGVWAGLSGYQ